MTEKISVLISTLCLQIKPATMIPLVVHSAKNDAIPLRINVWSGFIVSGMLFLYKEQVLTYLIDCYSLLSYNLQGYIKEEIGIEQQLYEIVRGKKFALNCLS